jgi:hypothetical protein
MVYLYDAFDQISDFCHQQLLRKMRRKISWTDRGKTVYPPPPSGSGGINIRVQTVMSPIPPISKKKRKEKKRTSHLK